MSHNPRFWTGFDGTRWLVRALPGMGIRGIHRTQHDAAAHGDRLAREYRTTVTHHNRDGRMVGIYHPPGVT